VPAMFKDILQLLSHDEYLSELAVSELWKGQTNLTPSLAQFLSNLTVELVHKPYHIDDSVSKEFVDQLVKSMAQIKTNELGFYLKLMSNMCCISTKNMSHFSDFVEPVYLAKSELFWNSLLEIVKNLNTEIEAEKILFKSCLKCLKSLYRRSKFCEEFTTLETILMGRKIFKQTIEDLPIESFIAEFSKNAKPVLSEEKKQPKKGPMISLEFTIHAIQIIASASNGNLFQNLTSQPMS